MWASDTEVVSVDYATHDLIGARLTFGSAVRVAERTRLFSIGSYAFSESSPMYDVARDGQSFLALRGEQGGARETEAIVVLNWFAEIERRMAEQGGR